MTLDELARAAPFAAPLAVPDWTLGACRRRSITFADGSEDDTTTVVWLQTHGLTGDVRIPAGRPDLSGREGLRDCSRDELMALAAAEGGVAETHYADGLMSWTGWSAFQPQNNWPEPGDLRRIGDCMIEFAPSGAYVEDWRYRPAASPLRVGLRLVGEQAGDDPARPRAGGLVIVGDEAIFSLGRRAPLPAAPLVDVIRDAIDLPAVAALAFDAVTSLARRDGAGWAVELSTNPFLEGLPLALGDFAPGASGTLVETLGDLRRTWRVDTMLG